MFDFLKKKLKQSVEKLTEKIERKEERIEIKPKEIVREEPKIEKEIVKEVTRIKEIPKEEIKPEKEKGRFGVIREKITTRVLTEEDIEEFFEQTETDLLQANIAVEVVDFLKKRMKEMLANRQIKRGEAGDFIKTIFEEILFEIVNQGSLNLEEMAKDRKPLKCIFLGFNGSGKTTTIAKVARYLQKAGVKPVIAAGDTFRAASIEQLEHHGEKLGVKVIKSKYGADSAAVIFDAIKFAEANHYDVVLADTAGRTHTDKNLMDELAKVVRVNKPDLKVLVVDSLTGNDAIEQANRFNEAIGVDAVVMTKVDVNQKGGSILSVCYSIKKPILFLGVGQGYDDLEYFEPGNFVKGIFS